MQVYLLALPKDVCARYSRFRQLKLSVCPRADVKIGLTTGAVQSVPGAWWVVMEPGGTRTTTLAFTV